LTHSSDPVTDPTAATVAALTSENAHEKKHRKGKEGSELELNEPEREREGARSSDEHSA